MRLLVTGGAGYVGGFSSRRLLAAGHEVTVIDDLSEGHRGAVPEDVLEVMNLADTAGVTQILSERRIEGVLHFAASTYVGVSVEDPRRYYRNNVANSLSLLEAMLDAQVHRIVFSSTCATYGETASMPLDEDAPLNPGSPYAFSKMMIEQMIRDFSRAYGLRFALLRYFNAAGGAIDGSHGEDHRPETHLIPLILQILLGKRDRLMVFGDDYSTPDGTCIRDYVHVEDLAGAHELAIEKTATGEPGGEAFNMGTGQGHSVLEVIRSVERVTGREVPYEVKARRPGDTARLVASSKKAHRQLGWQLAYPELDQVVESAWEWHRQHPEGYGD